MSKIFEEAIADTKKIKEIAENNAKKAIIESITPKIREFIEDQIINQGNKINSNDSLLKENEMNNLVNMLGINKKFSIDTHLNEAYNNLNETNRSKFKNLLTKINENIDSLKNKPINNKELSNNEELQMNEKFYEVDLKVLREAVEQEADELHTLEELSEEMVDLDELSDDLYEEDEETLDLDEEEALMSEISRLFEEAEEGEEGEEAEKAEEGEEEGMEPLEDLAGLEDDVPADDEVELPADLAQQLYDALAANFGEEPPELEGEEPPELEGEEMVDLEELTETFDIDPNMLRQELQKVKNSLKENKAMHHHFGGKGDAKAGVDGSFGGKGKKNAGVKSTFGGGKEGQDVFVNPPKSLTKLNEAIRKLRRLNRSQKEKLNKYRSAVQTLREQLEDLNLFNAKLLYVNKLLQNTGLNENQKKSVIKALDEAKTLRETKALYQSLTESLQKKKSKNTLSESARLGSSSRTTTSSATIGSSNNAPVGELGRWQKLAGLK
jgi:hypothetical protein